MEEIKQQDIDNLFEIEGTLIFDPPNITKKHNAQSVWKSVAYVQLNCDVDKYYSWFITKRFNLPLFYSIRGAHLTIINDIVDKDKYNLVKQQYHNKKIKFLYSVNPRTNSAHWWLRCYCEEAENIREELGLSRIPYFSFHLTIGKPNEKGIEHSKYI